MPVSILWFRHGLRIHDNPSLHEAIESMKGKEDMHLLPLFIFDGESAGTNLCGYNRFAFLLECLQDLDEQLQAHGSRLFLTRGRPRHVFDAIHSGVKGGVDTLCYEQDCEPVWRTRDEDAKAWCKDNGVKWVERVGHTLWNPHEVIEMNGGTPPLTFNMFNHVVQAIGDPERPLDDVDLSEVKLVPKEGFFTKETTTDMKLCHEFPTPETFGVTEEVYKSSKVYKGGEKRALRALKVRLERESLAFAKGSFLPNQRDPDILCPPKSLSPDLRFGCLSVRKFFWGLMDAFKEKQKNAKASMNIVAQQLVWREFFYTMSVNNPYYGEMERNQLCLNVPWYPHEDRPEWYAFAEARTGYPFIDAGMRQLYQEGWIHHVVRNAIACFLTRGDLWINWEPGLRLFLKYQLDADWSVCAGNWMWISSSAFEDVLSCKTCIDPATFARRFDPWGEYVKRYVPELAKYPVEYIYEPWLAPKSEQVKAGCVVGKDYPERIVLHEVASKENMIKMDQLKQKILKSLHQAPAHCAPSSEEETRQFMSFPESCVEHGREDCCNKNKKNGIEA